MPEAYITHFVEGEGWYVQDQNGELVSGPYDDEGTAELEAADLNSKVPDDDGSD